MTNSPIREDFLHFLWRTRKLLPGLQTTDGSNVEILEYGNYNTDAGPDFFNAKIRIGDTMWAGNVEMHVFTSDWQKHRHQHDKAYENVILHVVYENDKPSSQPADIPVLELKGKIPKHFLNHYIGLMQSVEPVPCRNLIGGVNRDKIDMWKYSLIAERLQQKTQTVDQIYRGVAHNWEETLYIMLARYFGARVNTEPFERLARKVPLTIIHKNIDKPMVLEALFFGQAGMLTATFTDEYFKALKKEYQYQQKKYNLTPMEPVAWKFARMRPVNFPTIRISQFCHLMQKTEHLFSKISEASGPEGIQQWLHCRAGEYWDTKYRFDTPSRNYVKQTGKDFTDILVINAVAPVLFHFGKMTNDESYVDKAIYMLEHTSAEDNQITRYWKELGLGMHSAFDSQALIHLRTNYCSSHACMSCRVGSEIMNRGD